MSNETTGVNDSVINQLAAVREGGYCNMLDRTCVRSAAEQIGFDELTAFLADADSGAYMAALEEMGGRR